MMKSRLTLAYLLIFSSFYAQHKNISKNQGLKYAYSRFETSNIELCEKKSEDLLRQTAEAYFYMSDYECAAKVYTCLFDRNNQQERDIHYHYIISLKSSHNDQLADKLLDDFILKYPSDSRSLKNNYSYPTFLSLQLSEFTNWNGNTAHSDYGGKFVSDGVLWCSTNPLYSGNQFDEWTGEEYSNIFYQNIHPKSERFKSFLTLNEMYHESTFTIDEAEQIVYYTRNKEVEDLDSNMLLGLEIRRARFDQGNWVDIGVLEIAGMEHANLAHPALSVDGKRLYFVSDAKGGFGESDIWFADIVNGIPINVQNAGPEINTASRESFPYVSSNGQLFFSSDGHPGIGGLDVFKADFLSDSIKIDVLPSPVNSEGDDFSFYLNEKEKIGFISSSRKGGNGSDDLYSFKFEFLLKTKILEEKENDTLENQVQQENKILEVITGTNKVDHINPNEGDPVVKDQHKNTLLLNNQSEQIDSSNYTVKTIYFELNSFVLTAESQQELSRLAQYLNKNTKLSCEINAYTDCRGSVMYNLELSRKRAISTLNYLKKILDNEGQCTAQGFGETNLLNGCSCEENAKSSCSEFEHSLNRRIEFKITD